MQENIKISKRNLCIFLFFLSAIIFRIYNLNYEDLWIDEIISFSVADPSLSLRETISYHNKLEQLPILYNLLLKFYFKIFGYNVYYGRYLSSIFSVGAVVISFFLILKVKEKSSLFFLILVSSNVYLIKYAQELRVYSLLVFLFTTSLFFFFKYVSQENKNDYNIFFCSIFLILSILAHPFSYLLLFSMIMSLIIINNNNWFKNKEMTRLNYSLLISALITFVYYIFYFINLNEITSWIPKIELKFFTNLFFSKFFGSRLLGIVHLVILLSLIFNFRKKIASSNLLIFLLIIFNAYFFPVLFSFIFQPILVDRYIIFIIIPVLIIISFLVYEIKKKFVKRFVIFIITFLTFSNLITENTIKQFFGKVNKQKPDFSFVLKEMASSNLNTVIIQKHQTDYENKKEFYDALNKALFTYTNQYILNNNLNLNLINISVIKKSNIKEAWFLCYLDIDSSRCKVKIENFQSTTLSEIKNNKLIVKKIILKKINE